MNISFISAIFVSNEKVDVIYNSVLCEPNPLTNVPNNLVTIVTNPLKLQI